MRLYISILCLTFLGIPALKAEDFAAFLEQIHTEAMANGVSADILHDVLPLNTQVDEKVLEKLNHQPEVKFSFERYFSRIVSEYRINNGIENFRLHRELLEKISAQTGVPAEVIVALWGIETAYGKLTGGFDVVPALATLAYDSHRKTFFRKELFNALTILQEGHIKPHDMTGSWAGAMGQCQFMPSSFLNYAVDGNGDGLKDIWTTLEDVFASTANYLQKHNWDTNEKLWVQRVILSKYLPADFKVSSRGLSEKLTLAEMKQLGLKPVKGTLQKDGRLFIPNGPSGKAYVVYDNFNTVLRWNNASFFAFSVLTLAEKIRQGAAS